MPLKLVAVHLHLDKATAQAFDDLVERRGVTRVGTMSRLVTWFAQQDEQVQVGILDLFGEAGVEQATMSIIRELAGR